MPGLLVGGGGHKEAVMARQAKLDPAEAAMRVKAAQEALEAASQAVQQQWRAEGMPRRGSPELEAMRERSKAAYLTLEKALAAARR
jgi:hypothetical protein